MSTSGPPLLIPKAWSGRGGGGGAAGPVTPESLALAPQADLIGGLLAAFYSALNQMGFDSGQEFIVALQEAKALNANIVLGDQPIDITLQRLQQVSNASRASGTDVRPPPRVSGRWGSRVFNSGGQAPKGGREGQGSGKGLNGQED